MGQVRAADVAFTGEGETLRQAGHRMRDLGVAALPVRGDDGRLVGIITRDMVVSRIAAGGDPSTVTVAEAAADLAQSWACLHIGELARAVRAAAVTVSGLGAAAPPPVTAATANGCHAA